MVGVLLHVPQHQGVLMPCLEICAAQLQLELAIVSSSRLTLSAHSRPQLEAQSVSEGPVWPAITIRTTFMRLTLVPLAPALP